MRGLIDDLRGPVLGWLSDILDRLVGALQGVLEELGEALTDVNLEEVVYPHPISGPLDASQQLEFLRFHLNRHLNQIESLKAHSDYPRIKQ